MAKKEWKTFEVSRFAEDHIESFLNRIGALPGEALIVRAAKARLGDIEPGHLIVVYTDAPLPKHGRSI